MMTLPPRRALWLVLSIAVSFCVLAIVPGPALAVVLKFLIDPTQSTISVDNGSAVNVSVGQPLGTVVMPAVPPTSGSGGTLPNGDPSDGLVTSIHGTILVDLSDTLDAIRFIGRRTSITLGTSGTWLPGPPSAPTTPTAGEIAVEFSDPSLMAGGAAVLRGTTVSLDSGGSPTPLAAGPPGSFTFPAGCDAGTCPTLQLEESTVDVETSLSPPGRDGLRASYPLAAPSGTTGMLEDLGGGRFKLTLPIDLATTLAAEKIGAGFPLTVDLDYSGQIVAVPEPAGASGHAIALAGLLALVCLRHRRARLTGAAGTAAVLMLVACRPMTDINVGTSSLTGSTMCLNQRIVVSKDNGNEVIGDFSNASCGLFGFMGNLAGTDFLLYPYANYSLAGTTNRFLLAGVSVEPAANFSTAMEIDHMMWFSGSYGAQEISGTTPQIYAKAFPVSFASASGEPIGGLLDVTVRGMTFPLALNGQYHFFDADPAGGTLDFGVSARTERVASGYGYQGVAISYGTVGKYCLSNYECASVSSLLKYCSPVGCHDGGAGKACSHDIQCDTASGYFCNSFGQCALGAVGDACAPDEGDCANGNACGVSLMCQINF